MAINKPEYIFQPLHYEVDGLCHCPYGKVGEKCKYCGGLCKENRKKVKRSEVENE